jgi:hypothetical protein
MAKKVPAILVLAALGTEVVFNEHHEPAVHQPHVEIDLKLPANTEVTASISGGASGGTRAQSMTVTITPNPTKDAPTQPHIEGGGNGNPVTDFELNQLN